MIETTITKIQYDADGVQRRWSIPFQYADAKHISIYTKVGEEPTVKVVDNYDIDEDDSVVIYPTVASGQEPLVAGTKIIIARETPETQLEDASQVHFTSKDVERGLDKLTMITQELSTTASETMEVSSAAFESAEEAVSTANEANATAGEAKTLAGQAVSVANDANATATSANTKSDTAIKIANDANEKSASAVSTASAAKTVVDEANSTANKANAIATEAKEIAAAANVTAINADKIANEADKKADNAIIIATDAKSIAEGIDAKATQALDNSNTAINTANSAKQIAEGINDKATQALANSTTALETATEAKNTADSCQGQITTIESKIPADASDTNQLADKQFVQDLTSALNFVQWVDALPETGESKYIYAVPREETDTEGKQIAALYLWDGSAWRGAGAFSLNIDPATLATKSELAGYLPVASKAVANGVASLDANTKVPVAQIPDLSSTYATINSLATVATSGSYNDLTNKPTIPTVNNATLTIQQNGSNITTFTANSSTNTTANITVPTKLSDLTNDSGFVKNGDVLLDVSAHSTANPRHIWQEKLDDCLYRAETRYKVNLTNFDANNTAHLFDGNTDTCCSILAGNTGVVSISGNTNLGLGYPYGYIYCTFYYGCGPRDISDVTCRVYQNWQGHNVGWVTLTGQEVASSTLGGGIKSIDTLRFYTTKHGINQIEITLNNTKGTSTTEGTKMRLCAINFFATRTSIHSLPVLTKFGGDTIYGNVTIPVQLGSFKGNLTGTADKSVKDGDGNTISSTYVKVAQKGVANGVASLDTNAKVPTGQIPVATASALGGVKPDGNTITVTEDGTISATGGSGSGSGFDFEGTKAEFDAAVAAGTITEDSVSLITDDVSGDNVATKAELQDRVAKAGDTMTGPLKMSGQNPIKLGTDDNYYYIQCAGNSQLSIFNKNNKGIFLQLEEAHAPFYWDGTNAFRLLTTADLPSNTGSTIQGAVNYSAQVSITSPFTCPTGGAIGFRCPTGDWNTLDLKINNIQVFYRDGGEYRGASQSMFATVSAGDVISWTGAPSAALFWPAK